jgi:hypothetical protein
VIAKRRLAEALALERWEYLLVSRRALSRMALGRANPLVRSGKVDLNENQSQGVRRVLRDCLPIFATRSEVKALEMEPLGPGRDTAA